MDAQFSAVQKSEIFTNYVLVIHVCDLVRTMLDRTLFHYIKVIYAVARITHVQKLAKNTLTVCDTVD